MAMILAKPNRKFKYFPMPKESPSTWVEYRRLDEKRQKEMREQCGRQFVNKTTGKLDFEIVDEVKLEEMMRDEILTGWHGLVYDDADENGGVNTPVPFSDFKGAYAIFSPWMKLALVKRAMGITDEADAENLIVRDVEDAAKNF